MGTVNLTIDGVQVSVEEGSTILAAAEKAGIEIPNLCFMKEMKPYGACGVCVVEVEKCPKLLRACATKVAEGMVVNTKGERALKARKLALELLMGDHDGDCQGPCKLNCPAHECAALRTYMIDAAKCKGCTACARKCPAKAITGAVKQPHTIDSEKCIKCGACAAACKFGAVTVG